MKKKKSKIILIILFVILCITLITVFSIKSLSAPKIMGCADLNYKMGDIQPNLLQGISAKDHYGRDLTSKIIIDDKNINWTKSGNYKIVYSVVNNHNKKTTIIRKITVKETKPHFNDISDIYYKKGDKKPELLKYVHAYDAFNKNLDKNIKCDITNVDYETEGIYKIIYMVTDSYNLTSCKEINLHIGNGTNEEIYPIIKGIKNFEINLGEEEPNYMKGIKAFDKIDLDITSKITTDATEVNVNKIGCYNIYYNIINSRGYHNTYKAIVNVIMPNLDIEQPKILGTKNLIYNIGDTKFSYLNGVKAIDDIDGDITSKIIIKDENVNYEKIGKYKVLYIVTDSSNNETVVSIELMVKDNKAPIIFNVNNQIEYVIGSEMPDLLNGVTARDNVDGNLTNKIQVNDKLVNYTKVGIYQIIYTVQDLSGNISKKIRKIEIKI